MKTFTLSASQISAWKVRRGQLRVSLSFSSQIQMNRRKTSERIHYLHWGSCEFGFECSLVTGPFLPRVVPAFLVVLLCVLRAWLAFCLPGSTGWLACAYRWPTIRVEAWGLVDDLQKCELCPILMSSGQPSEGMSFSVSAIFGNDSGSWGPHLLYCLWEGLLCPWVSNKKIYWFWFWITSGIGIDLVKKKKKSPNPFSFV